jgi:hypothetical protein
MPSKKTSNELTTSEQASMSDASDSVPPHEVQENVKIRDFLYHDVRRVSSLLAQFQTYGVRQQVKAIESAARIAVTETTVGGQFGVPMVGQGQAGLEPVRKLNP